MPRRRRNSTAGLVFHVCNRSAKRAPLFRDPQDYAAFERVLGQALARFRIALFCYCVMPNHWHLLLSPLADGALSRFMHWLTTTHARRWHAARGTDGQGAVYQGRFNAIPICADDHFLQVCRYVERNALRANLVGRAEDWEWSSLWCHVTRRGGRWLAEWPVQRPAAWVEQVNLPQTEAELAALRTAIRTNQPLGTDAWCREVRHLLGMREPGQRGRPAGRAGGRRCPKEMTPDPLTDLYS